MGQQIGGEGGDETEADRARLGIFRPAGDVVDVGGGAEHAAGAIDDLPTRFGEQHLPGVALEQLHPQLALEFLDLRAQCRLADEAGLGRLAEVAVVGHRHQVLQIAQVHRGEP